MGITNLYIDKVAGGTIGRNVINTLWDFQYYGIAP